MTTNIKENTDLKIIVIGKSGTGKTSFVKKWIKDTFSDSYKATIVSEYNFKICEHKGNYYRIHLWDISGQDKNIKITKIFSKDSNGCVVVCDGENLETRNE